MHFQHSILSLSLLLSLSLSGAAALALSPYTPSLAIRQHDGEKSPPYFVIETHDDNTEYAGNPVLALSNLGYGDCLVRPSNGGPQGRWGSVKFYESGPGNPPKPCHATFYQDDECQEDPRDTERFNVAVGTCGRAADSDLEILTEGARSFRIKC